MLDVKTPGTLVHQLIRYYCTPSNSSEAPTTGVRPLTFPVASEMDASTSIQAVSEVSRFPRKKCRHMPSSLTPLERYVTRITSHPVLPSRHPTNSASRRWCFRSSIARLCFPLSTLRYALAVRQRITRGRCSLLGLHRKTLSFSISCRF